MNGFAGFAPQGNVDTEAGGSGQPFSVQQAGNVASDTANVNQAGGLGYIYRQPDAPDDGGMGYYYNLGRDLLNKSMLMQQQMASQAGQQQMPMGGGGGGAPQGSLNLGGPSITAGFDMNWLASRMNAASSNGAAIGGMGKNPGQGSIPQGASGGKGSGAGGGFSGTNDGNLMRPLAGDVSY